MTDDAPTIPPPSALPVTRHELAAQLKQIRDDITTKIYATHTTLGDHMADESKVLTEIVTTLRLIQLDIELVNKHWHGVNQQLAAHADRIAIIENGLSDIRRRLARVEAGRHDTEPPPTPEVA
jgi:hypothetical protein